MCIKSLVKHVGLKVRSFIMFVLVYTFSVFSPANLARGFQDKVGELNVSYVDMLIKQGHELGNPDLRIESPRPKCLLI